jgi:hypothetical protein
MIKHCTLYWMSSIIGIDDCNMNNQNNKTNNNGFQMNTISSKVIPKNNFSTLSVCHQIDNYTKATCRGQSKHRWRWWTKIETTHKQTCWKTIPTTQADILGKNPTTHKHICWERIQTTKDKRTL